MDGIPMLPAPLLALIAAFCVLIAYSDIRMRRVPNLLLAAALVLGAAWFCAQWALGRSGPPWMALAGLLAGLAALLPFYLLRWMGAGDVKLFATLGFLLGAKALLPIWVIASLLGGAHAIYLSLMNYRLRHAAQGLFDVELVHALTGERKRRGSPYAAFLAIGALITLFNPLLAHW